MRVIKIDLLFWWEDEPSGNSELALYGKNWLKLGSSYSLWAGVTGLVTVTISTYSESPCTVKDQTQGLIHVLLLNYTPGSSYPLVPASSIRFDSPQQLHPCKYNELKESCSWSRCSLKDFCSRSILIWEGYCEFIFCGCNKIH